MAAILASQSPTLVVNIQFSGELMFVQNAV